LFVRRRGSTATLTAAGERLRQEATAVLRQGARLEQRTAAAASSTPVRLFAGPHIADGILRAALPAFHRAHPGLALSIVSEPSQDDVREMLQRNELDMAVFTAPASAIPPDAEVLGEVACVVVASRSLAGDRELAPEAIGRLPFVLPLEGAPAARWVEAALTGLGVVPERIAGRTQYMDVQQRMVETGQAAALLFRESVEASPVRAELRLLTPDARGLQRVLVTRPGERRPEVEAVAAFLRTAIRNRTSPVASSALRR
jgi:DNA-binding transcriptional LysR family regulator